MRVWCQLQLVFCDILDSSGLTAKPDWRNPQGKNTKQSNLRWQMENCKRGLYLSELCFHRKNSCWFKYQRPPYSGHSFASALNCYLHLQTQAWCSISARKDPSLEHTLLEGRTGAAEKITSTWSLPARAEPWVCSVSGSRVSRPVTPHFSSSKDGHSEMAAWTVRTVLGCAPHQGRVPGSSRRDAGGCTSVWGTQRAALVRLKMNQHAQQFPSITNCGLTDMQPGLKTFFSPRTFFLDVILAASSLVIISLSHCLSLLSQCSFTL